ncbi:ECF transporter S component [Candidatus Altiarchaeota archaeon]
MKIRDFLSQILLLGLMLILVSFSLSYKAHWLITSFFLILLVVLMFILEFERRTIDTRLISSLGILTATAVVSRQILHSVGGASPVFFFVILGGYVFGPMFGFMLGCLTIFLSNFFLGHGPWTPFQMIGLGFIGAFAGLLPNKKSIFRRIILASYGFLTAYFYGAVTNLFYWLAFTAEHTLKTFIAISLASLSFDTTRAIFNAFLLFLLSAPVLKIMERQKKKISTGKQLEGDS